MVAPSRMGRQGKGKVGMANESESLVEVALRKTWANRLMPKVLSRKPQIPRCGCGYPMLTQQRGRLTQSYLLLLRNVVSPMESRRLVAVW